MLVAIILFLFLGNARGALIVALTIPFSLLFASICLDLRKIPANLLSLGALDFGMVVDGAVVMVENIVRHMSRRNSEARPALERIREAAHEVQRPVFYAIGIIITAYLPIFTLQSVEGRLFKPMAWTVAFALLGALIFSMVLAPVLASFLFRGDVREWHNPALIFITERYRAAVRWAIGARWITAGFAALCLAAAVLIAGSGIIGSEFLPHLDEGAIWVRGTLAPSTGPTEGTRLMNQRAHHSGLLSGGAGGGFAGGPAGRWHRYGGLLQYRVLRRSEAAGSSGGRSSTRTRTTDRRHGPRTGEDSGGALELLAADRRQHGRGRQRREGRTGDQDLRRRSQASGSRRATRSST